MFLVMLGYLTKYFNFRAYIAPHKCEGDDDDDDDDDDD
jgi:hypothetical protein